MSQLDLVRQEERCGNCGTRNMIADTVVIDTSPQLLCRKCVARFDWTGWDFDPVLNLYTRA